MKNIILMMFVSIALFATAQDQYSSVLSEIENNSPKLRAIREAIDAQKLANKTGIYVPSPEIEFGYLWGAAGSGEKKIDFSVTQSFDFPSVYTYKNKIANLQNTNLDLEYKSERINILLAAKEICIDLTYQNALAREYSVRLANARDIATSFQKRYDSGEINVLEYNKSRINLAQVENEYTNIQIEIDRLNSELAVLNGGNPIIFSGDKFVSSSFDLSFDNWYSSIEQTNPLMQYVKKAVEIEENKLKLAKANHFPRLMAGYAVEKSTFENYQGVVVGISVPLWENKNTLKQAKADIVRSKTEADNARIEFYNTLKNQYNKIIRLQESVKQYRDSYATNNSDALLKKALDAGEISIIIYLYEVEYYYTAVDNILTAEKDLELAKAKLSTLEL